MNTSYPALGALSDYATLTIGEFVARFPHVEAHEDANDDVWYGEDSLRDRYQDDDIVLVTGDIFISRERMEELRANYHLMLAVDGNVTVEGSPARLFYVSGDLRCNAIDLTGFRLHEPVGGKLVASDCAWLLGEEPAIVRDPPLLRLETRYLFSCWYNVNTLVLSPDTVLFIAGEWDDARVVSAPAAVFIGAAMVFVLDARFIDRFDSPTANQWYWHRSAIEMALRAGADILVRDVSIAHIALEQAGDDAMLLNDYRNAYLLYKQTATRSPGYYKAWLGMAESLFEQGALGQAMTAYREASTRFPANQTGMVNEAAQSAALCAIHCGQPETAVSMATVAIDHTRAGDEGRELLSFAHELRAEASLLMGDAAQAEADLAQALAYDADSGYGNWLMGSLHYRRDEPALAAQCHRNAMAVNPLFAPYYDAHTTLDFMYDNLGDVDWCEQPFDDAVGPVRDEAFWRTYLRRRSDSHLQRVPEHLRTSAMCMELLIAYPPGPNVHFARYFSETTFTREMAEHLILRSPGNLEWIPERLIDAALLAMAPRGAPGLRLRDVPVHLIDHAMRLRAVEDGADLAEVPPALLDDGIRAAALAHGSASDVLPDWATREVLRLAVSSYKSALDDIPGYAFDRALFDLAHSLYGADADWDDIVTRHGQAWCIEQSYGDAAKTCWSAFWDEAFIVQQLSRQSGYRLSPSRIAPEYMTDKVAAACFTHHLNELDMVPAKWITQDVCDRFIGEYPDRLASVPVACRTVSVCQAAMDAAPDQLSLVPLALRSVEFCVAAVLADAQCEAAVPRTVYRDVFAALLEDHGDTFYLGWLYLRRADGALFGEPSDLDGALADYQIVIDAPAGDDFDESDVETATFSIGYCHYLRGDTALAAHYRDGRDDWPAYAETGFADPAEPGDAGRRA